MKRALSLIEVIIAMGLLSLLLSTLFFWYRTLHTQKEELNKLKAPLVEERYAEQRLHTILQHVELPLFTASDGSFVFIFDRGIYHIPELSGKVLGKIFYDKKIESLCLGVWPNPKHEKKEPFQSVILLDGIKSCQFSFYHPRDLLKKPVSPEEVGKLIPQDGWQEVWNTEFQEIPAFFKIQLTRDEKKGIPNHSIEYIFDFPVTIVYPKNRA